MRVQLFSSRMVQHAPGGNRNDSCPISSHSEIGTSWEETALKVFVELLDTGYPGSTCTLTYDPKTDRLSGVYYQAAIGQRFDVIFVRSK